MDPKMMHAALKSVMEDMGRAAREGRARRFTGRPKHVEMTMGDVTLEPTGHDAAAERAEETGDEGLHMDPVKQAAHVGDNSMTQSEMDELMAGMQH